MHSYVIVVINLGELFSYICHLRCYCFVILNPRLNFSISFTNIRSLQSNYPVVELHHQEITPDLLFISKTGLNHSIPVQEFIFLSYLPLKYDLLNQHGHGLQFISRKVSLVTDISKMRTLISHCLQVALVHSLSFVFTVYCPQDDGIAMFNRIVEKIDNILCVFQNCVQSMQESSGKCREWLSASCPSQNRKQQSWILQVLENCKCNLQERQTISAFLYKCS